MVLCEGDKFGQSDTAIDRKRKQLGIKCVDQYVRNDMVVGVGSDPTNTTYFALKRIAQKLDSGELKNIKVVPSEPMRKHEILKLGIPLLPVDEIRSLPKGHIDVAILGAEEVDPDLNFLEGKLGNFTRVSGFFST